MSEFIGVWLGFGVSFQAAQVGFWLAFNKPCEPAKTKLDVVLWSVPWVVIWPVIAIWGACKACVHITSSATQRMEEVEK